MSLAPILLCVLTRSSNFRLGGCRKGRPASFQAVCISLRKRVPYFVELPLLGAVGESTTFCLHVFCVVHGCLLLRWFILIWEQGSHRVSPFVFHFYSQQWVVTSDSLSWHQNLGLGDFLRVGTWWLILIWEQYNPLVSTLRVFLGLGNPLPPFFQSPLFWGVWVAYPGLVSKVTSKSPSGSQL